MYNIIFQAHFPPHKFETGKSKWWIERYTNALQASLQVPILFFEEKNKSSTTYRIYKDYVNNIGKGFGQPLEMGLLAFLVCSLN